MPKKPKTIAAASSKDILGTMEIRVAVFPVNCFVCDKRLINARVAALKMLGTPTNQWACAGCSTEKKKMGIFMDEVGTSKLLIVDQVYQDTVKGVFNSADEPTSNLED